MAAVDDQEPTPVSANSSAPSETTREKNQSDVSNTADAHDEPILDANVEPEKRTGAAPANDMTDNYKPKTLKFWLIMISAMVSLLLVALDRTILSTAIPRITDEFNSLGDIGWYGSAYMLTTACFQLVWGRIFRFYDLRWSFLSCIFIFEVGSAVCGSAPSSNAFIVGRAIAGIGAAGITTASMLTTIPMIPLQKRPMFQSLFGMIFGISSISGPLLGGAFTEKLSWRWCFYINLPVGVVAFFCLFFFFKPVAGAPKPPVPIMQQIMRLDPLGALFFVPSTVCLLLALQWGGSTYAWSSWRIILLFVLFAVTAVVYAVVQVKTPKTASLPMRVITQRTMLAGTLYMFFLSSAMMLCIYYIPIWFQTTRGANPIQSGIYTIPLVLSLAVAGFLSSVVTQRSGYYAPSMIISPTLMIIGEGLLTTFQPNTGSFHWIAFQFLVGFGLGFGLQTVALAVQTVLPKEDVPTGIAINFWAQQLGGAIFVSVGQTLLSTLLISQLSDIPGLNPTLIVNTGATELTSVVPAQYLSTVIEAYNYACTKIFLVAVALTAAQFVCAFGIQWKSIKTGPPVAHGEA